MWIVSSGSWYSQDVLCGCVSRTGTALNQRGHQAPKKGWDSPTGRCTFGALGGSWTEATNEVSATCFQNFMHNWFLGPPCTYSNLQISEMKCQVISGKIPFQSSYHSAPCEKVFVNCKVGPRVYRYKWNDIFPIAMAENKWVSTRWAPTNDKSGEIPTPGSKVIVPVAYIAI